MSGSGHGGVMFPQKAGRLPAGVPYTGYQQPPAPASGQPPSAPGYAPSAPIGQVPAATGYGRPLMQPQQQPYRPGAPAYATAGTQHPQQAPLLSQPMHPQAHLYQGHPGAFQSSVPLVAPLAPQQPVPTGYGSMPRPAGSAPYQGQQPPVQSGYTQPQHHGRPPAQQPPAMRPLPQAHHVPTARVPPQHPPQQQHHQQQQPAQPSGSMQGGPYLSVGAPQPNGVQHLSSPSSFAPGGSSHGQVMRPWTASGPHAPGRGGGGRGRGGEPRGGGGERPAKKSRREREFDAAAALPQGPVVVREPATDEERRDVEKWKAERRASFPTAANLARKAAEDAARREAGALDPARQERLAKLREVVALQRSMGVDHIAGTTDLLLGGSASSWSPRGGYAAGPFGGGRGRGGRGSRGGRMGPSGPYTGGHTQGGTRGDGGTGEQGQGQAALGERATSTQASEQDKDVGREVAGGIATRFQWVRHGYVPPVEPPKPARVDHAAGQQHQHGYQDRQHHQQQQQYITRPRKPSLLHRLLEKDIRRDHSWILQALRFLVRNNFLQKQTAAAVPTADASDGAQPRSETSTSCQTPAAAQGSSQQRGSVDARVCVQDIDWPPEAPEPVSLAQLLPPPPAVDEEEEDTAPAVDAAGSVAADVAAIAGPLLGPAAVGKVPVDGAVHDIHMDMDDMHDDGGEDEQEWQEGESEGEGEEDDEQDAEQDMEDQ